MHAGSPSRMCVYATASPSLFGKGIRYLTRPSWWRLWRLAEWQHVGLGFEFASGERIRHEALLSEGWTAKESWRNLQEFSDTPRNRVRVWWLPIRGLPLAALYAESDSWVGQRRSYAVEQIMRIAVGHSIAGRAVRNVLGVGLLPRPHRVICSEGVTRLLCAHGGRMWDMRAIPGEGAFDDLSPQWVADWLDSAAAHDSLIEIAAP